MATTPRRGRPSRKAPSSSNEAPSQVTVNTPEGTLIWDSANPEVVTVESESISETLSVSTPPKTTTTSNTTSNSNSNTNHNNKTPKTTMANNNREDLKAKRAEFDNKLGIAIDRIGHWIITILSIPFRFVAGMLEKFVDRDAPGVKLLGALVFFLGVIYTADGYWQASGNAPIFPLFAPEWTGWSILFFFNPFFWALIPVVFILQLAQSECMRGLTAEEAKQRLAKESQHEVGEAPTNKIKMASIYHKAYVNAGVRQNKFVAFVAISSLVVDVFMSFAARNPFNYGGMFWVVVIWNLFTVVVTEAGYIFWKSYK